MALENFLKKLTEVDESEVIHSPSIKETFTIIPPEDSPVEVEVALSNNNIPPTEKPKPKIPFRLNYAPIEQPIQQPTPKPIQQPVIQQPIVQTPPVIQNTPKITEVQQPVKPQEEKVTEEALAEELFKRSGTSLSKKSVWVDYYEKGKSSRKQNSVAMAVKQGRFAITDDNTILILPEYDWYGKSTADILHDKWLK